MLIKSKCKCMYKIKRSFFIKLFATSVCMQSAFSILQWKSKASDIFILITSELYIVPQTILSNLVAFFLQGIMIYMWTSLFETILCIEKYSCIAMYCVIMYIIVLANIPIPIHLRKRFGLMRSTYKIVLSEIKKINSVLKKINIFLV